VGVVVADITTGSTTPVALTARVIGASLVIATGAIHLYLYDDYFSSVPTIGHLFIANFVTSLVVGMIILWRRGAAWPLLGAGFCAATLGSFLWSVQWGLFGFQERLHGTWQTRAAVVEVAGVVACLAAAVLSPSKSREHTVVPRTTSA
jgi:hypothetical protein